MRKSKKFLAVTLALILAFSVMIVGASTVNAGALSKITINGVIYNTDASVSIYWSENSSCSYYQIAKLKLGDKSYTYTDVSYFSTFYNDKNVSSGTIYYYQIRQVRVMNGVTSYGPWSSTKSVTTLYRPTVTSLNDMHTMLNINWNKIKGVSHYRLAFKRLSDKAWNYRNVNSTYYNVPNPTMYETYAVQVCPMNGSIAGQWSQVRYVLIGASYIKPEIKSVSKGVNDYLSSIVWEYTLPCKEYYLYVQKAGDGYWTNKLYRDVEGVYNYGKWRLEDGNTYYFQVRALDNYGNWSPFSKVFTYFAKEPDVTEKKDLKSMLTSHKWRFSVHDESDSMKLDYNWLLEFKPNGIWSMDMVNSVDGEASSDKLRGLWQLDGTTLTVMLLNEEKPIYDSAEMLLFADDLTDEKIDKGLIPELPFLPGDISSYDPANDSPLWYVSDKYFCFYTMLFTAE